MHPAQFATRIVQDRRALRRGLPHLRRLARQAALAEDAAVVTAGRAAAFLDREVLAQADVEDALLDGYLANSASTAVATLLQPQHDTLRAVSSRLWDHTDAPDGGADVGGLLDAVHSLLRRHLDDEWLVLRPALEAMPHHACSTCDTIAPDPDPARPAARLHLPAPYASTAPLLGRRLDEARRRVEVAAGLAVRRRARIAGLSVSSDVRVDAVLTGAVASPHVSLFVGRLECAGTPTSIVPVEFEVVLTPNGDHGTLLEVHAVLDPPAGDDDRRRLLSGAAVDAAAAELAQGALGR